MQGERYDIEELRLALQSNVRAVLIGLGYDAKGQRNQLECARCPGRVHSRRRAMVVSVSKALWKCHVCGTGGDMIALVAQTHGLDTRTQFGEVAKLAAELVGLAPAAAGPEAEARRAAMRQRVADQERAAAIQAEREAKEREAAIASARQFWPRLPPMTEEAHAYLLERRLPPGRFTAVQLRASYEGVVVPLHDRAGEVVNLVTRRWPRLGEPKTKGRWSCPSLGTLVGRLGDVDEGGEVVLCEGVFDTLTAVVAWPWATVLGAHGAENLPKLATAIAETVRDRHGRLLIPPHDDKAGARTGVAVALAAVRAGLREGIDLEILELGGAKDLNEAWCKGWRP